MEDDLLSKLNHHAGASEYSGEDLEILIDILANHYNELSVSWREYYEELLSSSLASTDL